jgi:hypothetical protein
MAPHSQINNFGNRLPIYMLLGGMPGLVGKARVTHLRSLQESQKVSHGATRYSKGERVRDVRGVG